MTLSIYGKYFHIDHRILHYFFWDPRTIYKPQSRKKVLKIKQQIPQQQHIPMSEARTIPIMAPIVRLPLSCWSRSQESSPLFHLNPCSHAHSPLIEIVSPPNQPAWNRFYFLNSVQNHLKKKIWKTWNLYKAIIY